MFAQIIYKEIVGYSALSLNRSLSQLSHYDALFVDQAVYQVFFVFLTCVDVDINTQLLCTDVTGLAFCMCMQSCVLV